MIKPAVTIAVVAAVLAGAALITAQGQDENAIVRSIASECRSDLQKGVKKADADYFKRLDPHERRLEIARCRSIIATCTKTITALEQIAASAKRSGADVEAALAKEKIAIVREYLTKAQTAMPKSKSASTSTRMVSIRGGRRKFGGHYSLGVLRRVTWDEANRMAKTHGGYLAQVGSSQEMMFLSKLVFASTWVGGVPGEDPVQWQWQDGKKIADTFWVRKPPEVESNRRVHISSGGLETHTTTGTLDFFIIEWDR